MSNRSSLILGISLAVAMALAAAILSQGIQQFKLLDRTVVVKGLAEQEVPANIAIWPVKFSAADNDLSEVYDALERQAEQVRAFLLLQGFSDEELTLSTPNVTDKLAQSYGPESSPLRYSGSMTLTIYTDKVDLVLGARQQLFTLAKQGVNLSSQDYNARTEFLFTGLNDLKPAMIEQATRNAREVAQRFAEDSQSKLGKIRRAQQGIFSIRDRDSTTPHRKKVRVVSTVEYYLVD
ncbi:SIMPL domain-containing protein [Ferrimonas sp.]|uniref:SIMPL domain-containing protein n=1 Tax=Ferrimonas sp. TaxID=2080861 RepID=UPI003A8EBC67